MLKTRYRWIILCLMLAAPCGTIRAQESQGGSRRTVGSVPDWAHDAIWYHVVIPRFRNGDTSNDPDGTLPWTRDWPSEPTDAASQKAIRERSYGGDLQGLQEKLSYLKNLGINALILSPVFARHPESNTTPCDIRHIDDAFGVKDSIEKLSGETDDPKTWKFSGSDRMFLGFLAAAHKLGFRVVVHIGYDTIRSALKADSSTWKTQLRSGVTR